MGRHKSNDRLWSLSRERILQTAVQLADEEGITGLSMRRLADRLTVKPMSLYNHIANKEDLIDGMVEQVMSEIDLPNLGKDWQSEMRKRSLSAHQMLLRHPWSTVPIVSRMNVGSCMLRYIDATLGCLQEAGFSLEMADHVRNAIDSYVYGFTLQALNFPIEPDEYADAAEQGVVLIPADRYPYMHHLAQAVIDRRYSGIHHFEFGLDLILKGLAEQLQQSRSH